MSRNGDITLEWADGDHLFRLGLGELRELQEKTGHGPAMLARRIVSSEFFVDDVREVLRLGLIGGGAEPRDALRLIGRYCDERPLLESTEPALRILQAALLGPEDDTPGKAMAAKETQGTTGASPSPPSTAPAPQ